MFDVAAMDCDVRRGWSWNFVTVTSTYMGSQRTLVGWLPKMHGQHPELTVGLSGIFAKVSGILLAGHARVMQCHTITMAYRNGVHRCCRSS